MEKAAETLKQAEGLNHGLAFCVKRFVSRFFTLLGRVFLTHNQLYFDISWGLMFATGLAGLFLYLATGGGL